MNKRIYILTISIGFCTPIFSQSDYGNGIGNYLSTTSSRLNPASAGKMKALWMLSPLSLNTVIYNNFFKLDMPFSPYRILNHSVKSQYKNDKNKLIFDWQWLKTKDHVYHLNFSNINRLHGPSALVQYKKMVFGVSQEFTTHTVLRGVPTKIMKEQVQFAQNNFKDIDNQASDDGFDIMEQNNIYFIHHRYNSINLLISKNFKLIKNQDLSLGFTYKFIHSHGGYQLSYQTNEYFNNQTNESKLYFAKMSLIEFKDRQNKFKPHGWGGIDFGAQWHYQLPENKRKKNYSKFHPEYKFRLGFSVLDIGNLVYTKTIQNQLRISNAFSNFNLSEIKSDPNISQEQSLKNYFNSLFDLQTTYGERIKVGLPTRMVINTDFQVYKNVFINGLSVISLRKKFSKNHITQSGFLQLSPRYETRHFEIGFPLMLRTESPQVISGVHLRFYHFYIGSNQLKTLISPGKTSEFSLYLGFEISNYLGKFFNSKFTYMKSKKRSCAVF